MGTPMTPAKINAWRRMPSIKSILPTSDKNSLVVYSSFNTVHSSLVSAAMLSAARTSSGNCMGMNTTLAPSSFTTISDTCASTSL